MIKPKYKEIKSVATRFRALIEHLIRSNETIITSSFRSRFPEGQCLNTSQMLAKYYRDSNFEDVKVITGKKRNGNGTHAWVRVDAYIVDITANQFEEYNYPPVFVGVDSQLHESYIAEVSLYQNPDIRLSGTYAKILNGDIV